MQKKVWLSFIVLSVLISPLCAQSVKSQWVDSVFNTLDVNEKIGQLMLVPVNSLADQEKIEKTTNQIRRFNIGGIVLTGGGPVATVHFINQVQKDSEVPVLTATTAPTGITAPLDSILEYPTARMLGSICDDSLLFYLGKESGKQLNSIGVNIHLAPGAGVNHTVSSFGENQYQVAVKAHAFQQGLNTSGILSVPDISSNETQQTFPLELLVKKDAAAMVLEYSTPTYSGGKASYKKMEAEFIKKLSPALLKEKTNFDGLVIGTVPDLDSAYTDFHQGDAELLLLKAGNQALLFPGNIAAAIRKIKRAVRKDKILEAHLNESVKKILALKYDAGLHQKRILQPDNLNATLNTPAALALQQTLFEKSVTIVKDDEHFLPIRQLDNVSFASLSIGTPKENSISDFLSKYAPFTHYSLQTGEDTVRLLSTLSKYSWVVVTIFPQSDTLENFYPLLLQKLTAKTNVIVTILDSSDKLGKIEKMPAIILGHTNHYLIQQFIPQLIFGAKGADGTLAASISASLRQGTGIQTLPLQRTGYSSAEQEGLDSRTLTRIADIAQEAIREKAAPGCQVLITRHGKIIYEKSFGFQTYDHTLPVTDQTIYDLASVSKVMGTLQAVMFLYEKGMIDIYKKVSVYLPELQNTNKKDIILKDVLTHQSGLAPFLLLWPQTVKGDTLRAHYYSVMRDENYPLQVAPNLYASRVMQDSVWHWLLKSEMLPKPPRTPYSTRYSDLGFMILHWLVERVVNQPMEEFLNQNLYEPLGAGTVGYLPLTRFPASQIAPTEIDTVFRKTTVVGTVHDERAAMLGGVAGHAGLFGNGNDLLKLSQMLLQKGRYGGQQYYHPETVELFAHKQFENSTRGLGWAKPGDLSSPSSRYESPNTFGHTGFTGTCVWIDPQFDLVFIFLSNSRFPNRSGKLNTTNIRSRIQDTIYQSIFNFCQYGENEPDRQLMEYLRQHSN